MSIIRLPALIFIMFLANVCQALDLPTPPAGFIWIEAPEIKGAFLSPKNWFFKNHQQSGTQGYFITKENIDANSSFKTGVTINVVTNIPEKTRLNPTQFAAAYISEAVGTAQVLKKPWSHSMGPFNSYGVLLQNSDKAEGDFNTHNLVIANNETGTVYLVIFEAPTDQWEDAWAIGDKILGMLYIDSDI